MDLIHVDDCILTVNQGVAMLALNRDDVRNELTGTKIVDDLCRVVAWINAGREISALILTSSGKAFSAGGNVKAMRAREGIFSGDVYEQQNAYRLGIQRGALALDRLEVPSIAAINGPAIGAGLDFAMMCDMRIASDTAVFGETFANLGLISGDGGAWFLQRLIGYQRAAELAFSGRIFKADEALQMGVLLEVCSPDDLQNRAMELAASFASKPPRTVRLTKRLMKSARRLELGDFLEQCAVYQGMSVLTQDHLEAIDAFFEKRPALYSGR